MKINVHAGHNPDGKVACGAVGYIKESTEARKVKDEVINKLRRLGHTVYDCTCEDGANQANVLTKIVNKCNQHIVDLDVSIHFNAGVNEKVANGKTTGTEVYLYSAGSKAEKYANGVVQAIAKLGFKHRGVKVNPNLYFLRKTNSPAMLIECCFVDDKDDVQLYDYIKMADAIVQGITGQTISSYSPTETDEEAKNPEAETKTSDGKTVYRVQVGAYSVKENAEALQKKLKNAGFDAVIVKA